jgi:predicted amino acid racemase
VFLETLLRRRPAFVEAVIGLHHDGRLPANAFVLDLDGVTANARALAREAAKHGLELFAMTKQVGRAPGFCDALRVAGIDAGVAVDMTDARALARAGMTVGNIGHLVQIPCGEASAAASLEPRNWTVFSARKAHEAATAASAAGRTQDLLARIQRRGDTFYPGHEGGFHAQEVVDIAERLDRLDGARFAGVTSFPALVFDAPGGDVQLTPNLLTLESAAERLRDAGVRDVRVNAPGTTSCAVLALLAAHGATQVEPGHGLTGTTPLHRVRDLPELPAICYVTEVSHMHDGRAYAFGGGLYVDPVFGDYQVRALVADQPGIDDARILDAMLPPADAIDYYGQLMLDDGPPPRVGATVVFGFRAQAFVTRAYVVGVSGVDAGDPKVAGIWTGDGREATWPQ